VINRVISFKIQVDGGLYLIFHEQRSDKR